MKTKKVEIYVCEYCGKESKDKDVIIGCEFVCSNKVFPLVEVNERIQEKLKESHIVDLQLPPRDGDGKLAHIIIKFADGAIFQLDEPYNLGNLDEY